MKHSISLRTPRRFRHQTVRGMDGMMGGHGRREWEWGSLRWRTLTTDRNRGDCVSRRCWE